MRSIDDWRKDLQGKEPKVAYELVIADDSVAGYEAFTMLFAQSSYTPRMRSLLERRREMLAWNTAVAINTAASFDEFLASYGNSDLAATARKMRERLETEYGPEWAEVLRVLREVREETMPLLPDIRERSARWHKALDPDEAAALAQAGCADELRGRLVSRLLDGARR